MLANCRHSIVGGYVGAENTRLEAHSRTFTTQRNRPPSPASVRWRATCEADNVEGDEEETL